MGRRGCTCYLWKTGEARDKEKRITSGDPWASDIMHHGGAGHGLKASYLRG
ncbi:hypothetical protein SAMN05216386_1492 [Nitrosospira briensis]|uniref:Uncharacterized protein n=1 Tax=Nitrosospira briensis TaxID=35799 RepID=A0A1I5ARB5_9PROT|nr:hypothetical protein SAMN05216386_1492 [Nitrosospira briensis]